MTQPLDHLFAADRHAVRFHHRLPSNRCGWYPALAIQAIVRANPFCQCRGCKP